MPKRGDIREDGKVFLNTNKKCIGGEYWVTMEHFLKVCGNDYYERVQAYRDYLDEMRRTKPERNEIKKEKLRAYYAKQKAANPEKRREAGRAYHEKNKDNPSYIRRRRDTARRNYLKRNGAKIEAKKEAKAAKEKEKQERAKKRIEAREAAKALKLAILAAKPKRIVLTEDQRKERKRQEKRNYKHTRRARINNCEVKATPQMVEDARKIAGDRCYYCGKKSELTLDHFEPLAKGGAHCVSNFVFACFSCNSRKRDLDPFDFMASNVAVWL